MVVVEVTEAVVVGGQDDGGLCSVKREDGREVAGDEIYFLGIVDFLQVLHPPSPPTQATPPSVTCPFTRAPPPPLLPAACFVSLPLPCALSLPRHSARFHSPRLPRLLSSYSRTCPMRVCAAACRWQRVSICGTGCARASQEQFRRQ